MRLAIREAEKALEKGEVPVGAVLTVAAQIIGRGHNQTQKTMRVSRHAEMVAIERAERKLGDFRLEGASLYVTLEPCLMCLGAILNSRIKRVVYAVRDPKTGAVASRFNLVNTDGSVDKSSRRRPVGSSPFRRIRFVCIDDEIEKGSSQSSQERLKSLGELSRAVKGVMKDFFKRLRENAEK